MPVLTEEQSERKPRRSCWPWLLLLPPVLLLTALLAPVFVPLEICAGNTLWMVQTGQAAGSMAPPGVSSLPLGSARCWVLRLADWHYLAIRYDRP
ncbi:MAG: hypothetical protein K0Q72_4178, partial [Armatimonadetes bacterium]|nr:hypothetical protein [Armatimonadota bacterium]